MKEKKDKKEKFHFVTEEELETFFKEDSTSKKKEKKKQKEEKLPNTHVKEEFLIEEETTNKATLKEANNISNRLYISFEMRVILMLLGILALFAISCFFINKAVKYGSNEIVSYDETSKAKYHVCLTQNDIYKESCLDENMQYLSSLVNNIPTSFEYDVNFSDTINYDITYDVAAILNIYDNNDTSKSLYKTEDILLNKTRLNDEDKDLHLSANVNIDYQKYNKIVEEYKKQSALDLTADLKVILYITDPRETRNVTYITIPLGKQTFSINKADIKNVNQKVKITVDHWNKYTVFYGTIATTLLLVSLVLLYKMTRLVWKVTNNRNKYQTKLSQILREYDRIIVVARDGYESNVNKKIIKVDSFEELLDAKEALEKPIIYSKINPVKSEFIVEDDDKLYKYVFKEADI